MAQNGPIIDHTCEGVALTSTLCETESAEAGKAAVHSQAAPTTERRRRTCADAELLLSLKLAMDIAFSVVEGGRMAGDGARLSNFGA